MADDNSPQGAGPAPHREPAASGEQIGTAPGGPATRGEHHTPKGRGSLMGKSGTLLGAGLFALLASVLTWPRLGMAASSVVDYGDPLLHVWRVRWIGYALLNDPGHLFDAPIFHGYPKPLTFDDILIAPSIIALPLTALTGSVDLAYNLLILLSYMLAGWFTFLLARHVTGSAAAGLIAGTLGGFWSYTFAHISHLTSLSFYPLPLALLCLHHFFEAAGQSPEGLDIKHNAAGTRRAALWALGFASCFTWEALSSFYYTAYLALAAGGLILWELLVVRRWIRWVWGRRVRMGALLAGALLVSGAALAVISAPYREVQQELGLYRTGEQGAYSALLTDYLGVSPFNRPYRRVLPAVWPEPLFPGFIALALGVIGVVALASRRGPASSESTDRGAQGRLTGFYVWLAVGAVILTLGPVWHAGSTDIPLPYQLLGALPGFNGLRAPVRLAAVGGIAWGIVAGWGWQWLWSWAQRALRRARLAPAPLFIGATLLIVGLMSGEHWMVPTPVATLPPRPGESLIPEGTVPEGYEWLAKQRDSGVLVEMPIFVGIEDPLRTTVRLYYQGIHRHPLFNGHGSFLPPTYREIAEQLDREVQLTPVDMGILQSLDTTYVMFDQWAYKTRDWQRLTQSIKAYPEARLEGQFGEDAIYTLAPLAPDAQLRLGWRVQESIEPGATVPITVTVTNVYAYPLLARLEPALVLNARWLPVDDNGDAAGAASGTAT
ncbi:MAG: hypothetical protein M3328_11415, partial [Chloroflexota bacterium]|nr:hypothetical protein [Chloroflexota bacterium]